MARIDSLANFLEDVATKIRSKIGSQSTITPANYDTEIEKIKFNIHDKTTIYFNSFAGGSIETDTTTTSLDLKNLDTSNLKSFKSMFARLTVLESLDLSKFNTQNAQSFANMFQACGSLTSLDVSTFDTSNATSFMNMFSGCVLLETITFGNNWSFESASTLRFMFSGCTKLDNNTLNTILYLCTTATSAYTDGAKTLARLGIDNTFDNFDNIPNLSNYQDFLDAGWTIS